MPAVFLRAANFGTNDSGHQFIKGTGDPTVTQGSSPASSASQLVTKTVYDARGLVGSTIDPMGHRTRTFHDALGRTIATAEADDDGSVAITWSSGAWAVSGASTSPGLDRVNSYVYDGLGHVTTLTAHVTGGTDQVTTYSYGVSGTAIGPGTSGAHTVSSGLSSNDLLASIEYPPGSTSTTAMDRVDVTVDPAGRVSNVWSCPPSVERLGRAEKSPDPTRWTTTECEGPDSGPPQPGRAAGLPRPPKVRRRAA